MKKIILGTANLSQDYGVLNLRWSKKSSAQILEKAWQSGIRHFDTSPLYGSAEKLIGEILGNNSELEITTKMKIAVLNKPDEAERQIQNSIKALRVKSIDTLLIHSDFHEIDKSNVVKSLNMLLEKKYIKSVGISVYTAEEILNQLEYLPFIKSIQYPTNILDGRFEIQSKLSELHRQGIIFNSRSIFLQGILLAAPDQLPSNLSSLRQHIANMISICEKEKISRIALCMSYVQNLDWIDGIIVGANTVQQLEQIIDESTKKIWDPDWEEFIGKANDCILDPRTWPQ
jgi:aryl-alcohol dehydrogenase-like predicted oxidoreductase